MPSTITSQSKAPNNPIPNQNPMRYPNTTIQIPSTNRWYSGGCLWIYCRGNSQLGSIDHPSTRLAARDVVCRQCRDGETRLVYRFVAWALCGNQRDNARCHNCLWAMPKLPMADRQYPPRSLSNSPPTVARDASPKPQANNALVTQAPTHQSGYSIKIDEIRELQPFVTQSSGGLRIVVIHQADAMTLAASNALLRP